MAMLRNGHGVNYHVFITISEETVCVQIAKVIYRDV